MLANGCTPTSFDVSFVFALIIFIIFIIVLVLVPVIVVLHTVNMVNHLGVATLSRGTCDTPVE